MAALALFEQHIQFTIAQGPGNFIDALAVLASNFIKTLPANSANGRISLKSIYYYQWDATTLVQFETLDLVAYVTPQFQQTVQQNIAGLQSAFPTYTVSTYGVNTQFGN